MKDEASSMNCERVTDAMASVLDGSAEPSVLDHVTECDSCRDARHDAERSQALISAAGRDFVLPSDFKSRLVAPRASAPPPFAHPAPGGAHAEAPSPRSAGRRKFSVAAPVLKAARRWAVPALAAAAATAFLMGRDPTSGTSADDPELVGPPWRGKVAKVITRDGKLELCAPTGSPCRIAHEGDEIPAGSRLRTDGHTLAELSFSDGSALSLDRQTTLRLSTRGRGGELVQGALVADVERHGQSGVRFEFKAGYVDVLGTKFSLRSDDESAQVLVVRGQVRLSDGAGHDAVVLAGEEGRIYPGSPPVTSAGASLGTALGFSETMRAEPDEEREARPRALGELKAQKPGEKGERDRAVRLDSHAVRVKIAGSVARTEVEEVFTNQTDDVLEGIFRFPLPPDAKIERLALEVDGRLEEGAFVDRERASAIWRGAIVNAAPQLRRDMKEEIVWVPGPWKDPALLEWQRGGRFELRIFPIPKRGSRRVVLAYSQVVKQSASVRRYSYPLAFDPSGDSTPVDFSVDVQVRGHDPNFRVRTPGWDVGRSREDGAERLRFAAKTFVPSGDFAVDYALPDRGSEVSAWAYRDGSAAGEARLPYLALALRPKLPRGSEREGSRSVALVVDASRSVFGENYRRATALATRLARDLDADDRVTVLACHSTCRQLPGEPRAAGASAAREVRQFLEQETPEGASDVALAVARGFRALRGAAGTMEVVYLGDGTATAGPIRPGTIERAVRATLPSRGRVTSVGIGPDSDLESLLALARGGGGVALPYLPGQPLSDAALAAISALNGAALSDVRLELPPGVSQLSPARLDPISSGAELVVGARLDSSQLQGDAILRGTVNGRPFEQRYPLHVVASESSGNAFVPRLFAAARISDLERDGSDQAKREAVALSVEHSVASRYTSLLVLESEAMYKAFGLDNRRKTPEYTADLEAEGTSGSGELAVDGTEDAAPALAVGRAVSGGRSIASAGASSPRKASTPSDRGYPLHAANPFRGGIDEQPSAFPQAPTPSPEPKRESAVEKPKQPLSIAEEDSLVLQPRRPPPMNTRPLIPMRRVWERHGQIFTDRFVPKAASGNTLTEVERELSRDESRRSSLKRAFALTSAAGDLIQATRLAERWLAKEPLDPEAITAVADVEARRGNRDRAIRMLGSVLDVRPGDTASHKRLARLERWAGRHDLACRHSIAIAEGKSTDLVLVGEAVACARSTGMGEIADALLAAAPAGDHAAIERGAGRVLDQGLGGDVQLEASWSGGTDIDVSLVDTDGHRISWLGAATRSLIRARDVTSSSSEGLALVGAAPGEYVVELTRGDGGGPAHGELVIRAAGATRRVPFTFDGERKTVALLRIEMRSRLIPL